ncbi:MAG: class I SAM-dependent methyltransferase [Clostridia bacterium]|nr:class I SAM-dependent methyltransferase [Deltaproteobacteria bacterium]
MRHILTAPLSGSSLKVALQYARVIRLGKLDRQEKLGLFSVTLSMSATGFAYLHPWTYSAVMRVLHRGAYALRYEAVTKHIPPQSSVIDLCCGDAELAGHLPDTVHYTGLDANKRFVEHSRKNGRKVRLWDARSGDIPSSDVVVIQSSLYQFHPNDTALVKRAFAAATKRLVIAEPVINWTTHGNWWQRALARRMTRVSGQHFEFRHNEQTLDALVDRLGASHIVRERAGRDYVLAIDK